MYEEKQLLHFLALSKTLEGKDKLYNFNFTPKSSRLV